MVRTETRANLGEESLVLLLFLLLLLLQYPPSSHPDFLQGYWHIQVLIGAASSGVIIDTQDLITPHARLASLIY